MWFPVKWLQVSNPPISSQAKLKVRFWDYLIWPLFFRDLRINYKSYFTSFMKTSIRWAPT